ncbi:MAG: 2-C-methyl-D-erythritol 4-phosphate cytidylyltransferase [Defluviitaleaceae bacterium]|nr:2-C-methyl-D-erythritol 4-phosphate cytidylyltransferase [Defluviitaleaceae bacterium]
MKITAVIPASGAGVRVGGDVPKQFLQLGGEPILKRVLAVFDSCEIVAEIAVAVPDGYAAEVSAYNLPKVRHIVTGKKTRAESVFAALQCLSDSEIVLIHDGIRPFVTHEIIEKVSAAVKKYGAAIAASPVTDTIKEADANGLIAATPDRAALWRAQTPQGFTYREILRAYELADADGTLSAATDDSSLAERAGISVKIVPCDPANIKITTPFDLKIAEMLVL